MLGDPRRRESLLLFVLRKLLSARFQVLVALYAEVCSEATVRFRRYVTCRSEISRGIEEDPTFLGLDDTARR